MGEVFAGRYELLDLLGEGGMGSVWRVHDRREDRIVAAKVLRQSDAVSLLRFVREQAVRVAHPHVVTPLGWAGEDDRVLFTMPVVEGGSVATLVGDHGPLPPLLVAEIVRQLLDALAAVHAAHLVHRDVKPGNVLLAATGAGRPHAYLTDFGIAVDLNGPRLTQTGQWTGTPGYAAPESRLGVEPAPAEDLYSAGLLGLAMLTGARPVLPVDRPTGVPDALWLLLTDLTRTDPSQRPDSARDARARLDAPELAWDAGAMGEVEVLRQVGEVPAGQPAPGAVAVPAPGDEVATRYRGHEHEDTTVRRPARPDAEDSRSERSGSAPDDTGLRVDGTWLVAAGVVVAAVVGLLVWSPWTGDDTGERPDQAPPVTTRSSATTVPTQSTSRATPSPTAPTTVPSSSTGTVQVGTVVVRVGQPCTFTEVGVRDTTVGGVPVVCTRGQGGDYSWERP